MKRPALSLTLIVVLLASATASNAQQRAMTVMDLINVPGMSGGQLSPDGRQILYTITRPDWKGNKTVSHIWRINADGSGNVQMTNGTEGEGGPKWAPDGKRFAFSARRAGAETGQLYLMPNDGGEAAQLTTHTTSVGQFAWSPDGSLIYFSAAEGKTPDEQAKDKSKDDVYQFDENYKMSHLWRVTVADKKEARLTRGDYTVRSFDLSRDGRQIVMTEAPNPLLDSGEEGEIWTIDATGENAKRITNNKMPEGGPELSPDRSQILFTAGANAKGDGYYNSKLFVVPAAGGATKLLTPDFPYEIRNATWSKDGKAIYFFANMGVHTELFRFDVASGKADQLTKGEHVVRGEYVPERDAFMLSIGDPGNPGEIYLMAASETMPHQVTHQFDDLIKDYRLPKTEVVHWKGADGVTVEGILYYPLDYTAGQKVPLMVQTHGGPQAADQLSWVGAHDYVQVLAAKGYAVLKPNYRGSTGYGDAFLRDMVGQYFKNAHKDVMAGVDYLVARGIADPERMAAMGWSAGGHMTNKLITFTTKFKAAASGAGAADWQSMYAQSDTRTYRTPWFGGTPWQKDAPIAAYWDNSPLKYVANVTTPTIFLVGEKDERVPMPQSVEMYRALKSNGIPTHLYVAPREGHGWQELRHRLYKANAELDWFEKYVTKRGYVWEKAPGEPATPVANTTLQ